MKLNYIKLFSVWSKALFWSESEQPRRKCNLSLPGRSQLITDAHAGSSKCVHCYQRIVAQDKGVDDDSSRSLRRYDSHQICQHTRQPVRPQLRTFPAAIALAKRRNSERRNLYTSCWCCRRTTHPTWRWGLSPPPPPPRIPLLSHCYEWNSASGPDASAIFYIHVVRRSESMLVMFV